MKFWDNPFKNENIRSCVCDKEQATFEATPELFKRNLIFAGLGLVALFVIILVVGIDDLRIWPLIGLEVLYLLPYGYKAYKRNRLKHSLKCSLRYAFYTTY